MQPTGSRFAMRAKSLFICRCAGELQSWPRWPCCPLSIATGQVSVARCDLGEPAVSPWSHLATPSPPRPPHAYLSSMQIRSHPRPLGTTGLSSVGQWSGQAPLARCGPPGPLPRGVGPPRGIALGPSNFCAQIPSTSNFSTKNSPPPIPVKRRLP
jgi:hypothetical protein